MKDIKKIKIISETEFDSLDEEKRPKDNKKHVGVELEFITKAKEFELQQYIIHAGLSANVNIGHDSSINCSKSGYRPIEMRILADEKSIYKVMSTVCDILHHVGSEVNKSCGMHVHLDMRTRQKERAFYNLVQAQPLLFALNPSSRQKNHFCRKTPNTDMNAAENQRDGINRYAYDEHRTIEVRIHAGTLDKNKINHWIKLLIKIADHDRLSDSYNKLTDYVKEFKLTRTQVEYVLERMKKFGANPESLIKEVS